MFEMFRILKNFAIYLHIVSCTAYAPKPSLSKKVPEPTIGIDLELEQQVQQEILPFEKLLSEFKNTPDEKQQIEIKGKILGKLDMLVRKSIKADDLLKTQGALETEKERSDLYRVLLGVGHRVDDLEKILSAGSNVKLEGPRDKRWTAILNLDNPLVKELRKKITNMGMIVDIFAASVQKLCPERNERAGHVDVSLPEVLKENSLDKIMKMMKIYPDENTKRTLQLLISPLTLPSAV